MSTKDVVIKDAKVLESLMGGMFRLELMNVGAESGAEIYGSLSGKMRKFKIRIMPGDMVKVEFSPHDLTRGRISYRYR